MGFHWGKIKASGLICNSNLPITKFQFIFHNIPNARAPKYIERERERERERENYRIGPK